MQQQKQKRIKNKLGIVAQPYNPSVQESEARGPEVQGQLWLWETHSHKKQIN